MGNDWIFVLCGLEAYTGSREQNFDDDFFFIFCTHSLILESIEKVFLLLLGNTMMGSVVDFILAPIIALGIITGAAYILKYRMYTVWKIVTGNR